MDGDAVMVALEEQVNCYRRLSKLAQAQHECVQQSQTEELLRVLVRRQEVLEQIRAHEAVVGPARRQWGGYVARLDAEGRRRAERMIDETRLLLEEITAADRDDALVLQQRKLSIGRQINAASSARQVNRTYAAAAYGGARRLGLDLKGE